MTDKLPRSRFARVRVTDSNFTTGNASYDKAHRSRLDYDRQKLLGDVLRAYRLNPLARRIVNIYREFAIGNQITYEVEKPRKVFSKSQETETATFLREFWNHPINKLDEQIPEWFDERTLTGNLFLLCTVDDTGMLLVRALPTEEVTDIETRENDYRQEIVYHTGALDDAAYPAYDPTGAPQKTFLRHYVINRPVGSVWGESDLFPVLPWIARQTGWLEGRASLNYYRSLFVWVLTSQFASEEERQAREAELKAAPPSPNSILVKNTNETWETLAPKLEAYEASADGLALKKAIAAGVGLPLHFLAEPEGSNRTTAEAAGTPTFKVFRDYQQTFFKILADLLLIACQVRARYVNGVLKEPRIEIHGPDISERDNANLALALSRAYDAFAELYDRKLISKEEFLRVTYEFAGETFDPDNIPENEGLRRPLSGNRPKPTSSPQTPAPKVDPDSGETVSEGEP